MKNGLEALAAITDLVLAYHPSRKSRKSKKEKNIPRGKKPKSKTSTNTMS